MNPYTWHKKKLLDDAHSSLGYEMDELIEEHREMVTERETLYAKLYKLTEDWERESVRWYLEQEEPSPTAIIVRSILEQHVSQVRAVLSKVEE